MYSRSQSFSKSISLDDLLMPNTTEIKIKVSSTIADEWSTRAIHDVIPNVPEFDYAGGELVVTTDVAREILADCDFNADRRAGPEEMPIGTRRAYRAMAEQVRKALHQT